MNLTKPEKYFQLSIKNVRKSILKENPTEIDLIINIVLLNKMYNVIVEKIVMQKMQCIANICDLANAVMNRRDAIHKNCVQCAY